MDWEIVHPYISVTGERKLTCWISNGFYGEIRLGCFQLIKEQSGIIGNTFIKNRKNIKAWASQHVGGSASWLKWSLLSFKKLIARLQEWFYGRIQLSMSFRLRSIADKLNQVKPVGHVITHCASDLSGLKQSSFFLFNCSFVGCVLGVVVLLKNPWM